MDVQIGFTGEQGGYKGSFRSAGGTTVRSNKRGVVTAGICEVKGMTIRATGDTSWKSGECGDTRRHSCGARASVGGGRVNVRCSVWRSEPRESNVDIQRVRKVVKEHRCGTRSLRRSRVGFIRARKCRIEFEDISLCGPGERNYTRRRLIIPKSLTRMLPGDRRGRRKT
jgi:hypothetical protein